MSIVESISSVCAVLLLGTGIALAGETKVTLAGDAEVPAVATKALGTGTITVSEDRTISGSITVQGMAGTVAHIHVTAAGKNGPPIVSPVQTAGGCVWTVPAGSQLSDAQYASYRAGELYVNVHSAEHKSGEIRAQITP